MEPLSIPFTNVRATPNFDGLISVRGVIRTEVEGLVVEFRRIQTKFGYPDVERDEIRTIAIPWPEIQAFGFRRRFLVLGALVVRTRTLRALDGLPMADGNQASFHVAYGDRLEARDFAATVEMALADRRLAALDAPSTPPALPPS